MINEISLNIAKSEKALDNRYFQSVENPKVVDIIFVTAVFKSEEFIQEGFEATMVDMAIKKIYQNQFKRRPPLIAKLTSRTIGHDFLYPRDIKL